MGCYPLPHTPSPNPISLGNLGRGHRPGPDQKLKGLGEGGWGEGREPPLPGPPLKTTS